MIQNETTSEVSLAQSLVTVVDDLLATMKKIDDLNDQKYLSIDDELELSEALLRYLELWNEYQSLKSLIKPS